MHEVEARGLFTFCVSVCGHQANTHPAFCGTFFIHTACHLSTSERLMFCFLQRPAQFIFPLHLNEPIAPSSVHVTLLGVNAPFSFSVSWSHTSFSQPRCTHERRFRQHHSLLSFPPAVSCFARNNLPHAHLSRSRVFFGFSHIIVNIATCNASSLHPTPPPRQIRVDLCDRNESTRAPISVRQFLQVITHQPQRISHFFNEFQRENFSCHAS